MKNADVLKSLKTLLCVSLEVEPGPCPKAALLFLGCPSLVFASFPSGISNCLNLPFGTQGRSWRLESRNGTERLLASVPRSPTGSCWVSARHPPRGKPILRVTCLALICRGSFGVGGGGSRRPLFYTFLLDLNPEVYSKL